MSEPAEKREVLQRLAAANVGLPSGPGVQPEQLILLGKFYDRKFAQGLKQRLAAQGVSTQTTSLRRNVVIQVALRDHTRAFDILQDYQLSHPATSRKRFRRKYDFVFLVGLVAFTIFALILARFAGIR